MKHVITLPYPVSNNEYKKPRIVPMKGRKPLLMWYLTKEAQAYKAEVAWRLRAAGIRELIEGRICVGIQLYPKRPLDWQARMRKHGDRWDDDVQCLDLDNARKVLLDAMQGVLYPNDKWIWKDWGERMEPDEHGARIVVTIEEIARKVRQPALDLAPAPRIAEEHPF